VGRADAPVGAILRLRRKRHASCTQGGSGLIYIVRRKDEHGTVLRVCRRRPVGGAYCLGHQVAPEQRQRLVADAELRVNIIFGAEPGCEPQSVSVKPEAGGEVGHEQANVR